MTSSQILSKKEFITHLIKGNFIVMHEFINSLPEEITAYNKFVESLDQYMVTNKLESKKLDKTFDYYLDFFSGKNIAKNNMALQRAQHSNEQQTTSNAKNEDYFVNLLSAYDEKTTKKTVDDFVNYFKDRLTKIKPLLLSHSELSSVIGIKKINKTTRDVALIGLVYDKRETKNGNLVFTLEDESGSITCIVNQNKTEVFNLAKNELLLDEVVGVKGNFVKDAIFVTELIFPDIPVSGELKKLDEEVYAVFLSDLHAGSTKFIGDSFNKFLEWINGDSGSYDQKMVALKTRFVFITGDLVAGVGIYPHQENELTIKDIDKQYGFFFDLIKKIPRYIKVIICPGNHDAMRLSEPQPIFNPRFTKYVDGYDNIVFAPNPCYVEIGSKKSVNTLVVLMYHGFGFDDYVSLIPSIRYSGGYDKVDDLMKILLKKRHLAPTHTTTLYMPGSDGLVIDRVPDIFAAGHVHKYKSAMYKNIAIINGSCWETMTAFQEKVGHIPEPGKVAVVNLNNRKIKTINFAE